MHTRTLFLFSRVHCASAVIRCPIWGPRYNAPPASGSEYRSTYACAPRKQQALLSRLAIPNQFAPRQPQFLSTTRGPQSYHAAQRQRGNPAHRGATPSMGPFIGGPTSRGRHRRFKTCPSADAPVTAHQRPIHGSLAGGGVGPPAPPTEVSADEAASSNGPCNGSSLPSSPSPKSSTS